MGVGCGVRRYRIADAADVQQAIMRRCADRDVRRALGVDPELAFRDERTVAMGEVVTSEGGRLGYTYDFGDSWEPGIVVEAATVAEPGARPA